MSDKPTVSVVIPAYNAERYIGETLQSVLAQTYRDFEVVVVDDGSTDGTREIVRRYGERVRLIEQPNSGPSAARNRGIREARGEFIAFVDSDDLWLPEKLTLQMPLFADDEVGLVYCRAARVDAEGRALNESSGRKPQGWVFEDFLLRNHCPTSGAVVRREAFERCGYFPEDMVWAEDWHLWLRIAREYRFAAVEEVLTHHRVHGGALTRRHWEMYRGARSVLESALTDSDPRRLRRARRRGLHRLDRNFALLLLALGEAGPARRIFARALGNGALDIHAALGLVATLLPRGARRRVMRTWRRLSPWLPWDPSGEAGEHHGGENHVG